MPQAKVSPPFSQRMTYLRKYWCFLIWQKIAFQKLKKGIMKTARGVGLGGGDWRCSMCPEACSTCIIGKITVDKSEA